MIIIKAVLGKKSTFFSLNQTKKNMYSESYLKKSLSKEIVVVVFFCLYERVYNQGLYFTFFFVLFRIHQLNTKKRSSSWCKKSTVLPSDFLVVVRKTYPEVK